MIHFLSDLGNVAIWAGAIVPVLFFIQYTILAPWWKTPVGRSIVALDFCLFIVLGFSAATLVNPFWSFWQTITFKWIVTLAICGVPLIAGYRMLVWEKMRRRRQHHDMTEDGVK